MAHNKGVPDGITYDLRSHPGRPSQLKRVLAKAGIKLPDTGAMAPVRFRQRWGQWVQGWACVNASVLGGDGSLQGYMPVVHGQQPPQGDATTYHLGVYRRDRPHAQACVAMLPLAMLRQCVQRKHIEPCHQLRVRAGAPRRIAKQWGRL